MSDHNHDNGHGLVEGSGLNAKPVLVFLAVLGLATALVYVIIKGVIFGFYKMEEMNPQQPATAIQTGQKLPPEPRLQGAPEPNPDKPGQSRNSLLPLEDMEAYRKKVDAEISSYGWVDEQGGVARIPIDRAKAIIAEKGLPKLSDSIASEVQTAEAARKLVMNAGANGGRAIKNQKQNAPAQSPAPAAHDASAEKAAESGELKKAILPVNPTAKAAAAGAKH